MRIALHVPDLIAQGGDVAGDDALGEDGSHWVVGSVSGLEANLGRQ